MQGEKNMRMTKQRQIILEELRGVTSHPTADDMYEMIRKRLPRISLGTVYRNLEILSEKGIIQKLSVGGTKKRFDGDISEHYHLRCTGCGRVDDVCLDQDSGLYDKVESLTGYKISRHSMEFLGVCPVCLKLSA